MKFIGGIIAIIGILIIFLGGLGLTIYHGLELVTNYNSMDKVEVFWHIIGILFRDIIAFVVGIIIFIIGGVLTEQ